MQIDLDNGSKTVVVVHGSERLSGLCNFLGVDADVP